MSLSNLTYKVQFNGNGSTTAFSTGFPFADNSHLVVNKTVVSTGVTTLQVITTNYTVAGAGVASGGTVTMLVAPATGTRLTIERIVPLTQPNDFSNTSEFPSDTAESSWDRAIQITQQISATGGSSDRALKYPSTEASGFTSVLPSAVDRADKVISFDSSGVLELADATDLFSDQIADIAVDVAAAASSASAAASSASAASSSASSASSSASAASASAVSAAASAATAATYPIPAWVTSHAYIVGNTVYESNKIYRCATAHTSGTFATDLAAVKWVELSAQAAASGSITSSGYTQNTARLLGRTTASSGAIEEITVGTGLSLSAGSLTATGGGKVAQVVRAVFDTYTTAATAIPADDTIPQIGEGTELLTLAVTPTNASSTLYFHVGSNMGCSGGDFGTIALFVDATGNALAAAWAVMSGRPIPFILTHSVSAASTSSRTYRLRVGSNAGTWIANGYSGTRLGGGVVNSFIQVTEVLP